MLTDITSGQAAVGSRLWLWFEGSVSFADGAASPEARDALRDVADGEHVWVFVTTEHGREVSCTFSLVLPRGETDEARRAEMQEAAADFLAILKTTSIDFKPQ